MRLYEACPHEDMYHSQIAAGNQHRMSVFSASPVTSYSNLESCMRQQSY